MKKIKSFFQWVLKSRVRTLISVIVIIVLSYLVWKNFFNKTSTPQYQTARVEKGTIISTVSASGAAITANIMPVTTDTGGLITKVYVKDGDKVAKGQTIATVMQDATAAQQSSQAYNSYLSAKNSLFSANNNLLTLDAQMWSANQKFQNDAVTRGLATTDPIYIQENDSWLAAEAAYKNQQNVIVQVQTSLNNAWISYQTVSPTITSPISGVIDNISISEGMNLASVVQSSTGSSSSTKVADIMVGGNPLVTLNVSEIDISKVKVGQKATITFDSLSGKTYTGKVVSVDKVGTVTSGVTSYPVTIKLDTDSSEILPNMSSSADIIIATKDSVLMVPSAAVQTQNGQDVVRVLQGSQVQNVNVVIGLTSDTQTEIVSGLSEGQTVITGSVAATTTQGGSSIFSRSFGGGGARVITGGGR